MAIHRCGGCGAPGKPIDIYRGDEKVAERIGCDACKAQIEKRLSDVRPVFDAMVGAGAQREFANDVMAILLDHLDRVAPLGGTA